MCHNDTIRLVVRNCSPSGNYRRALRKVSMKCPKCGHECEADFVDNGVGEQRCGPWACLPDSGGCGWCEEAPADIMVGEQLRTTGKVVP